MRHRIKTKKFSRSRAQRKALIRALLLALIKQERIVTTTLRAKYLRGEIEKLITKAKRGTLADRRFAYKILGNHDMVTKLFDGIAPRFPKTQGGYTRVLSVGVRKGDAAALSLIELTKIEKKKKASKTVKASEKNAEDKIEKTAAKKEKKTTSGIASKVKKIFKKGQDKT